MSCRWKLDENLGRSVREVFLAAGEDVHTVRDEGLQGRPDDEVFQACQADGRAIVTLDQDFAQILRYPPQGSAGIVVFRVPPTVTPSLLATLARQVVLLAKQQPLAGRLWLVEPGHIRIRVAEH